MTAEEFNLKYKNYIEEGFDGLEFDIPAVTDFLDKVFLDLVEIPGFNFAQIKMKFGSSRFYSNLKGAVSNLIEQEINNLMR